MQIYSVALAWRCCERTDDLRDERFGSEDLSNSDEESHGVRGRIATNHRISTLSFNVAEEMTTKKCDPSAGNCIPRSSDHLITNRCRMENSRMMTHFALP
jgi:hypothetical protein